LNPPHISQAEHRSYPARQEFAVLHHVAETVAEIINNMKNLNKRHPYSNFRVTKALY
jgi:hypothetical protein